MTTYKSLPLSVESISSRTGDTIDDMVTRIKRYQEQFCPPSSYSEPRTGTSFLLVSQTISRWSIKLGESLLTQVFTELYTTSISESIYRSITSLDNCPADTIVLIDGDITDPTDLFERFPLIITAVVPLGEFENFYISEIDNWFFLLNIPEVPKSPWAYKGSGYKSPQSQSQFKFLFQSQERHTLIDYISKSSSFCQPKEMWINTITDNIELPDHQIYGLLASISRENTHKSGPSRSTGVSIEKEHSRAMRRAAEIKSLLDNNSISPSTRLLDIGCGDGLITQKLADMLGIEGTGLETRLLDPVDGAAKIVQYDGKTLPFETNSVDIITALMVLHHVGDIKVLTREIQRVLVPGGHFIIREHDCDTPYKAMWLDIMHGLYSLVLSDPPEDPLHTLRFSSKFLSKRRWTELFDSFELIYETEPTEPFNNAFYLVLRNPG